MPNRTPFMSDTDLGRYLRAHLANEVEWLLRATAEWHVQKTLHLCEPGYEVEVFARDSAMLHARTLFEFFTQETGDNYYGCDVFHVSPQPSPNYKTDWKDPLHAKVMHAQDRSQTRPLKSFDGSGTKPLDEMPLDFAHEVVRLWRAFSAALAAHPDPPIARLGQEADAILSQAIQHAGAVLGSALAVAHGKQISP